MEASMDFIEISIYKYECKNHMLPKITIKYVNIVKRGPAPHKY